MRLFSRADLEATPDIEWLWEGIIPTHSLVTLVARGGLGKTTMCVGLAGSVHHGIPFLGRAVKKGRVLYVVLEGHAFMKYRIRAWEMSAGVDEGSTEFTHARAVDFSELRELQKVEKFDVIIVDTASKSGLIDNENANNDVAAFLDKFEKAVHEGNPAAVAIAVHHVTETTDAHGRKHSKARGASAWRDNSDVLILMEGRRADFRLTTDEPYGKQRDGDSVTVTGLSLQRVGPAYVVATKAVGAEPEGGEEEMRNVDAGVVDSQAKTDLAQLRKKFRRQKPTVEEAKKTLGVGHDRARKALDLWK